MTRELQVGETVTINVPGHHRMHGRTGVVDYTNSILGTVGVSFDGDLYGFLPHEVVAVVPDPEPCHECRCHISPPCSACENCTHYDGRGDNCENPCRDCQDHEED